MSTTSKKYFDEKFKDSLWDEILKQIQKLKSGKELEDFLNKFFTPNEKIIFEKRLAIIHLLKSKYTYRQIAEKVDITRKTISFVKKGFKYVKKGFK